MKRLSRSPQANWRVESRREEQVRRALDRPSSDPGREDVLDVGTVTILAGGMMHQLNLLGGEIWKLCDGTLDREGLVSRLLEDFEVDEETLRADVDAFLDDMIRKGLIHEG